MSPAPSREPPSDALSPLAERALQNLEWPELLARIANYSPSRAATRTLLNLQPATHRGEAQQRFLETEETLALYANGETLPTRDLADLREPLARLERGAVAEARELRDVAVMLSYARELRTFARGKLATRPTLAAALDSDPNLASLERELLRCIDESGAIADAASPALASARRRARSARVELLAELGRSLKRHSSVLRDAYHTEWEGRYVLPVRSDSYQRGLGIVLGSSGSGGTLYVEPQEVTELGNRFKIAESDVEREEERVLIELSQLAHGHSAALTVAAAAAVTAGRLIALARWAKASDSVAVPITDEPRISLKAMRHPLMAGSDTQVVPNDLLLEAGNALIISGPNAGGKTVALKCLGLAVWMARAGLPIPAALGSNVGWFDPVLTDFGDQQSIAQSLSTFSAHIRTLRAILTHGQQRALVLIDEVAAGTDPQEGSALAAAILEQLVAQGAAIAVTTHYELLKELAARQTHFTNASMVFDFQTMQPTFRLLLGVPGRSSALLVAARYGIAPAIIERAEQLLPTQALEREKAVEQINAEREALFETRQELERTRERHAELLSEVENERRVAREQERARLTQEAQSLTHAVKQARATLEHAKKQLLERPPERSQLKEIEKSISEAARHITLGSDMNQRLQPEAVAQAPASSAALVSGATVYVPKLGHYAIIAEPPKRGRVSLRNGSLRLEVSVSDVILAPRQGPAPKNQQRVAAHSSARSTTAAAAFMTAAQNLPRAPRTSDTTLDLRGVRVEEGLEKVDAFIDALLGQGQTQGFVLHGHGTGAMKMAVRAHLETSSYVAFAEPAGRDDGGDAFTVFWLRE